MKSNKNEQDDVLQKIKLKYLPYEKKYKLPPFESLDKEFQLYSIDEFSTNLLYEIRRQITSTLNLMSNFLLPVLSPAEGDIHSLIEASGIKKELKIKMSKLFKKMQYLNHLGITATLKGEKETAKFINLLWKQWPLIKKEMIVYAQKITEVWAKEQRSDKADVGYLG